MSNINYNYFFEIELLHKYFASGLCNDFNFIISAQTQSALNGSRIIAKQYGNKLYTGLQVDDAGKPFIMPPPDLKLTFFLWLNNSLFFNYTNLPVSYPSGKVYYFTNRNDNVSSTKNFISQFAVYDNGTTYQPGDIATDGTGTVFQCLSTCKNVSPSTANNANWMIIDKNQYVSEADALQWMPSVSTYTFTAPQANASIDVFGFDVTAKQFTDHIISNTITFKQSAQSFKLDLSKLQTGKYKLTINGVTQWIYINDELSAKKVFAVIEIFNNGSVPANYKLLNGVVLKSPLYSINFLNRATIWKYILNAASKGNITIAGFSFPSASANTIISQSPIPLSETPLDVSLKLNTVNNAPANPAINIASVACASPQILTNFIKGSNTYACSEIFLNH